MRAMIRPTPVILDSVVPSAIPAVAPSRRLRAPAGGVGMCMGPVAAAPASTAASSSVMRPKALLRRVGGVSA